MKLSFFDYFPTPKYLKMPRVGIYIGDTHIRFVEIIEKDDKSLLGRFGEKKIPEGAIFGGFINKPDQVIGVLKEIKRENGFEFVKATLPEEKSYLFETKIPRLSDEEIKSAVEFKIEENVPVHSDSAIFDYKILGVKKDQKDMDLAVSVLPTKVVEAYVDLFNKADMFVTSFEIESEAIAKAIVRKDDKRSVLVVFFGNNKTSFYVLNNGIVLFTSTVDKGGDHILNFVKNSGVFVNDNENEYKPISFSNSVDTAVIKNQIRSIISYWAKMKSTHNFILGDDLSLLVLGGEASTLPGLADYLVEGTALQPKIGNVWENLFSFDEYVPQISMNDSLKYTGAIGLCVIDEEIE